MALLFSLTAAFALSGAGADWEEFTQDRCGYQVRDRHPHDQTAFTQGLTVSQDDLIESTGSWGASTIRRVDIESGRVESHRTIHDNVFGEGATVLAGRIYSLTWQSGRGYIWDEGSLEPLGRFSYEGEGWGLTNNGYSLILSDGTSIIRFIDPRSMKVIRTLDVRHDDRPIDRINELEWVNGRILANVWQSEKIAVINADSGIVEEWIHLDGLRTISNTDDSPDSVLNGIAYDPASDRLYVTGKNWPWLYRVVLDRNCRFQTRSSQKSTAR